MAERLVYSPKAYVYVKNVKEEVLDLSEYVIAGEVNRLVDQVSTAKITLRNPDRIFTRPPEVAFHPMDPITIFLERTPGHPVQVFTGFLNRSPYYQMRPGPIVLEASCTLKKLLYTWFQLAQPYTLSLLEHYGWVPTAGQEGAEVIGPVGSKGIEGLEAGEGKALANKWIEKAGSEGFKNTNGVPFGNEGGGQYATNDGSFATLLWAILFFIGDWKDEKIWIENVPPSVPKLVNKLWNDFEQNNKATQEEVEAFWAAAIGTSSKGSGGGPLGGEGKATKSGNLKNAKEIAETMITIAADFKVPAAFVMATSLSECGWNQSEVNGTNSANATGWFQFTSSEPYPGQKVNYPNDARDTAKATEEFCKAAARKAAENPNFRKEANWEEWATTTQVAGAHAYSANWNANLAKAKEYETRYGGSAKRAEQEPEKTERGGKSEKSGSGQKTNLEQMISKASEISNKNYHYSWGGGHASAGTPSMGGESSSGGAQNIGFDCSGSVSAVLVAGGYIPKGQSIGASGSFGSEFAGSMHAIPGPSPKGKGVTIYYNSTHEWMTINGRYFSTGWNKNPNGGAGWGSEDPAHWPSAEGSYQSVHLPEGSGKGELNAPSETKYTTLAGTETETEGEAEGGGGQGSSGGDILSQATAAAFASNISFPSAQEFALAEILGGQKALMNSKPLMELVQQVCQASLRSFQSLPNGDFFAFYPDYFGEFGHREAYWYIYDVEILDGGIELSDENLVTHVFSLGNPLYPAVEPMIAETKAGVMTIFEAMDSEGILYNLEQEKIDQKKPGVQHILNREEAVKFLQRYGPRKMMNQYPLVTSTVYECLLAYQQFLLGWSRQFITPFSFTFMPELFPGGKVGFPEHGIQMYIESVTHTWDTTNGYETVAQLTAPSLLAANENSSVMNPQNLPPNMVDALIEPIRGESMTVDKLAKQRERKALPHQPKSRSGQPTGEDLHKAGF